MLCVKYVVAGWREMQASTESCTKRCWNPLELDCQEFSLGVICIFGHLTSALKALSAHRARLRCVTSGLRSELPLWGEITFFHLDSSTGRFAAGPSS
jgi:hypothetical protein